MLTRSFIQSYLLVQNDSDIKLQKDGLDIINNKKYIQTIEPTDEEKEDIRKTIIKLKEEENMSYKDFLTEIFNELKIDSKCRKKLEKMISEMLDNTFERETLVEFINNNKKYC